MADVPVGRAVESDVANAIIVTSSRAISAAFTDDDTFSANVEGQIDTLEASGQMVLRGSALLQVDVGVSAPPLGVEVVDQPIVQPTMKHPGFIRGVPLHPIVLSEPVTEVTATGTAIPPPPPPDVTPDPPAAPTSRLDVEAIPGFTYRWRSSSLSGSVGSYITSWPEYNSAGPAWQSSSPYRPKVVKYSNPKKNISYASVVNFNWASVEHMWLTLPSQRSQPSSWVFIMWLNGRQTSELHTHVLDSHEDHSHRRLLHLRSYEYRMEGGGSGSRLNGRIGSPWSYRNKLFVLYGVFNGSNSLMRIAGDGFAYKFRGSAGSGAERKLLLGRQRDFFSKYYASNMSVLEILYYQSAIQMFEHTNIIERYARQTYKTDRW